MSTLNSAQVAERLHMQPATVARLANAGDIEASYIGRRWVFTEQAVEDYLAATSNREKRSPRRRRRRAA